MLSSKRILLCFIQKSFEVSVMIIVVSVPCSRAPGAWLKKETLPAAAPKTLLVSFSRGRMSNISGHKIFEE